MPIYEYRCPHGHTFERWQSMSAPDPESCDTCGASPVEKVLYPVAVHYKGSGFYSTDYGRGSRKKDQAGSGDSSSSSDSGSGSGSGEGSSSSSSGGGDSKPASSEPKKAAEA
jgi:putative FmdB family regulatory protein